MLSTGLRRGKKTATHESIRMERLCHHCGRDIGKVERVGRRDACLHCGWDLHCCMNCEFYDRAYNNHCRETQAERQVDKEVGNFCEYFSFRLGSASKGSDPTADARKRLDSLFPKKK
jgi:hypothetical protein